MKIIYQILSWVRREGGYSEELKEQRVSPIYTVVN